MLQSGTTNGRYENKSMKLQSLKIGCKTNKHLGESEME